MFLSEQEIQLAQEFGHTPLEIRAITDVYKIIDRFSDMEAEDIDNLIIEDRSWNSEKRKVGFIYSEIPYRLAIKVKDIISSHGDVAKFFSPGAQNKYLKSFILNFIRDREQPSDYLFSGIIIGRGRKRAPEDILEDKTRSYEVEMYEYSEEGAA